MFGLSWASPEVIEKMWVWAFNFDRWTLCVPKLLPPLDWEEIAGRTVDLPKSWTGVLGWADDYPTEPIPLIIGQNLLTWPICQHWKHTYGVPQVPVWYCWQRGHLIDISLPLKARPWGDIPNFDDCGELIESIFEPEEFSKESKLRFFFDVFLDVKPSPFLFWKLPGIFFLQ